MRRKITIDKAIETLSAIEQDKEYLWNLNYPEACKLGIEALKRSAKFHEWTKYSKPTYGVVGDLGECATVIAHIPIRDWDELRETEE